MNTIYENGEAERLACTDPEVGELIFDYEMDTLTEAEDRHFERHLMECDYCVYELVDFAPYAEALRAARRAAGRWRRLKERAAAVWARLGARPEGYRWALAAAVLLLLIVTVGYFRRPADGRAAGLIAVVEDDGAHFRNGPAGLTAGLSAYRARDYETAITKLGAVDPKQATYYVAQYFLGLCHLKQSDRTGRIDRARLAQAVEAFGRAAQAAQGRDHRYHANARLAMAKAYLMVGEREKALQELTYVEHLSGPEEEVGPLKETARALKRKLP